MRRAVLLFSAVLLATSSARADIPLPPTQKYVDPIVQFDGVGQHSEYVFYLRYITFSGGPSGVPHTLVAIKDSKPHPLDTERRLSDFQLLAIKKSDFDKRPKGEKLEDWLTPETAGVLAADLDYPPTVIGKFEKVSVTRYRVSLKDGKLTAALVEEKKNDVPPIFGLPWSTIIGGLALSLAVAWAGLLLARRPVPLQARPAV